MKYSELNNDHEREVWTFGFWKGVTFTLIMLCTVVFGWKFLDFCYQSEQKLKKRAKIEAEALQKRSNGLRTLDSDAIETLEPFDIDTNRLTQ